MGSLCWEDLDLPEPCWCCSVRHFGSLWWLTFAAVWDAPQDEFAFAANEITRTPKLPSYASIAWVLDHPNLFAVLNLPADFAPKLKLHPLVVNAPTSVDSHEDCVFGIGNQVVQSPLLRHQADVYHSDDGQVLPAVSPHAPVTSLGAQPRCRFA